MSFRGISLHLHRYTARDVLVCCLHLSLCQRRCDCGFVYPSVAVALRAIEIAHWTWWENCQDTNMKTPSSSQWIDRKPIPVPIGVATTHGRGCVSYKALLFLPPFSVRTLWLWALHIWEVFTSATIIKWLQRPVRGGLFALATHISFQFYGISSRQVVFRFFFSILFENNHYVFYISFESHYKSTNITYKNIYMYICIMIYL